MKTGHLIPPVLALAIAGALFAAQQRKISNIEEQTALLKKHISTEKSRAESSVSDVDSARSMKPEGAGDEIDWKEVAESFEEMRKGSGIQNMRKMMSFQRRLLKMEKEELLAALDQIQLLDLDDDGRIMLESMLMGPLVLKDPELVLNRFSDRIEDDQTGMSWQLANALGQWAGKDQAAAIAWFDKEIAAGSFDSKSLDGKSRVRLNFERALIAKVLSTDQALAEDRIAALPADQRKEALEGSGYQGLKEEDHVAYAKLVRAQLPEDERYEVLGEQASRIAMTGSLEKVDGFLDRIGAAGEERIKAAEKAAIGSVIGKAHQTKITEEKINDMRDWLGTQSPGSVDRVTGETLGQIANYSGATEFSDAAAIVLSYHERDGNDDVLTGFLEKSYYGGEKEENRRIAEQISDPKKREEALEKLK